MKKRSNWQVWLGIGLVVLAAAIYTVQYLLFRNRSEDIVFYLFQDLAFVPIQVLLVTLVLQQLLSIKEKRAMMNKLNMVIGTFFSEIGNELLRYFPELVTVTDEMTKDLLVQMNWTARDFDEAIKRSRTFDFTIETKVPVLANMKTFLMERRGFMLSLLENQNLLEHESFTDQLWAIFHLTDELAHRSRLDDLPASDYMHINGDIKRVYLSLIMEWLAYLKHLKSDYPYLFSLALRLNPFDPLAKVEVR
ncbi:MAG: hypothetical protein D4R93_00370 [Deltaproteobacteria bacterium]|nr:MAG: hypothetical protein D4R93_00370 [Deltaproteobacteria bacterium]